MGRDGVSSGNIAVSLHQSRSPRVLSILPHGDSFLTELHWIRIVTLTWMLPLNNSCPTRGANIGTICLDYIHCRWTAAAGECLPLSIAIAAARQQGWQDDGGAAAGGDGGGGGGSSGGQRTRDVTTR